MGGAIFNSGGNLTVYDSIFTENTASELCNFAKTFSCTNDKTIVELCKQENNDIKQEL